MPFPSPPNYPNDVPYWWCVWRQTRIVGPAWPLVLPLVWSSAWQIKHEIDDSRREMRQRIKDWDTGWLVLVEALEQRRRI